MKHLLARCIALGLCMAPICEDAGAVTFPPANLPDNGARLGITMDTSPYSFRGLPVVKIIGIDNNSPLTGIVHAGDYIYSVNGFDLRNSQDVSSVIGSGGPGSTVRLGYLDGQHNWKAMDITFTTIAQSMPANTTASSGSFCGDHPYMCGFAALGAVAAGIYALSSVGSGSSSRATSTPSRDSDRYEYYEQRRTDSTPPPPPEEPRTYGLYGNCPQPGVGYGC